ncbi:DUF4118 domain-containing protein [Sphingomonas sp. SUN039]|uniref:DUF4118 domain-containing protein n=1 Tax=Sphingomonas sp. SUN039 TaxID=2937787 RepID=UPI002164ADF9|nr:DUF4118 domain-containing protein [Sphingomonas sp. SUN039]UVO53025.1 DUF4118 domain-containing protein [Sphingomonas sp. SUN039]
MEHHATTLRGDTPALSVSITRYAAALLAVAVATLAGLLVSERWGAEPVVLLYIPAVLAAAIYAGLRPALAAAVASALAYNYWFTAPYHTLRIDRPADIVTVVVLFVVAVVTSQLAARLREQARIAAAHAARNAAIAGFARRLLSCTDRDGISAVSVDDLARLFGCNAVMMAGPPEAPVCIAGAPGIASLAPSDIAAAGVALSSGDPVGRGVKRLNLADWQFRPVTSDSAILAAVGLARDDGLSPVANDQLPLLGSLLDQIALAMARAAVEREAREVVALRERDRMRSVLLGSIGADIKPRLNAIGAAARALRREGTADKTLVAEVAAETVKLDRYIESLADLGPGPDHDPLNFGDVVVDLRSRAVSRDGITIHLTPKEYAVLAELAKHAGRVLSHAHLLRAVWGPAQVDHIDYLRVAVRTLRQKLEVDPSHPRLILNEPAVGYRLVSTA